MRLAQSPAISIPVLQITSRGHLPAFSTVGIPHTRKVNLCGDNKCSRPWDDLSRFREIHARRLFHPFSSINFDPQPRRVRISPPFVHPTIPEPPPNPNPRSKKIDRERHTMARSRGGCLNCKARKRKCDQARPECHACSQRGMRCQGYSTPLRWVNGVASRGRFAGASVPDASLVATQGPESSQDLNSMDSETSSAPRHDTSSPASGSISSSAFSPQTIGVPSADAQDPRFQRCMLSSSIHSFTLLLILIPR